MKDVQLLKELGPGLGHVSVIQELLDQVPVSAANQLATLDQMIHKSGFK